MEVEKTQHKIPTSWEERRAILVKVMDDLDRSTLESVAEPKVKSNDPLKFKTILRNISAVMVSVAFALILTSAFGLNGPTTNPLLRSAAGCLFTAILAVGLANYQSRTSW